MGVFNDIADFLMAIEPGLMLGLVRDYDARLITAVLLLLILPLTYTYTTAQSHFSRRSEKDGAEPPQVPYLVPFLGNTYAFASSPASFFAAVKQVPLH